MNDEPGKLFDGAAPPIRMAARRGGCAWSRPPAGSAASRWAGSWTASSAFLGRDGAFGNDGKFHPLGAEVLETTYCQQPDGAGNVFIAVTAIGLPASGDGSRLPGPRAHGARRVPRGSLRDVFFGLLGPEAVGDHVPRG